MNELMILLNLALQNKPSANFSSEDTNTAAVNALMERLGLNENSTSREIRACQNAAFALIEEAVDEILPKRLENILGQFAEVKQFARDAEVVFNIEKIGKNRAKLTISKGARSGIYRAAKLDSKYFSVNTHTHTVAVVVTLEEILLGTSSLADLFNNILEGFEEIVYKEVFNALATGSPAAGYSRINGGSAENVATNKEGLSAALDKVLPYVKQYGIPTIFGSYSALEAIANEGTTTHPELEDSRDRRNYGFVQVYKGVKVVELPNYLVDNGNSEWFYDTKYVFVLPSDAKPVKVALKGDMVIINNTQATGGEKREASKMVGVGVAMANNFSVITVSDAE